MIRHDKCKFTRLPGPYCALIGSEMTASNIVPVWRNRVKIPSLLWCQMPPSFENHETRTRFQSVAQPNMAIQNGAYPKSSHNQLVDHHGSHYHTNSWNRIIIKYRIFFSLVIYMVVCSGSCQNPYHCHIIWSNMPPSDRQPVTLQSSGPQEVCPDKKRGRLDTADISSGPWRTRIQTRMGRDGDTKPLLAGGFNPC
jgi:hypothetical protein